MTAWKNNERTLYGWLLKQTGDSELSQDLLQDVFLKSLERRERFCTLEHADSWLFTITRNRLVDSLRKQHPWPEIQSEVDQQEPEQPILLQLESCMLRVLTELKEFERDVIEQCDIQKISRKTYARQNGLTLPATKARLKRARQKLRERMIAACQIQFDETGVSSFTPRR